MKNETQQVNDTSTEREQDSFVAELTEMQLAVIGGGVTDVTFH